MSEGLGSEKLRIEGRGVASDYATALLEGVGRHVARSDDGVADRHPALEWAVSGAMFLSGWPDEPPHLAPGPLASCARGASLALAALGPATLRDLDGPALLGERAALAGLERRGAISPGGSCHLIPSRNGWLAVNLGRAADLALLPAWLEDDGLRDFDAPPWSRIEERVATLETEALVERARLMGLPVAPAVPPLRDGAPWFRVTAEGPGAPRARDSHPRVLDLSSLWAGPLCAQLLGDAGAHVVKVESLGRPDGARRGPAPFFDLLNAGKSSVALDLASDQDLARLEALIDRADIVVESARPRALQQLGLCAEALLERRPGLTWVSITGYGRAEPRAQWVAFGDDAGVAAGLSCRADDPRGPVFCGDAIADPLAGLHAAVAALASWREGGGVLLDVNLYDVTAHCLAFEGTPSDSAVVERDEGGDRVRVGAEAVLIAKPRARPPSGVARPLGADTDRVLAELDVRC